MSISQARRPPSAIGPEVAVRWWVAIDAAGAAIHAAEEDRDLSASQAWVKRQALLSERRWLESVSERPLTSSGTGTRFFV
jgi:hypothetical protein